MKINLTNILKILFFISILETQSFAENPVYSDNLLDSIALSESSKKDVLVIFTADWCKYCSIMKNDLKKDESLLEDKIICLIDFDTNHDLVKMYNVKTIPDYFILKNKVETKRKVGYTGKSNFMKWLKDDK
jgi:thiol-disulfide isomerase/thioredoxin